MVWPLPANYATNKNLDERLIRKENNPKPPNDDCRQLFCRIKGSSNPNLSTPFFTEEQLVSVFWRFDINRDRRLSRQELKNAFNSLGSRFPTYRAFAALRQADENSDGHISEEEMDELIQYASSCGYHVQ